MSGVQTHTRGQSMDDLRVVKKMSGVHLGCIPVSKWRLSPLQPRDELYLTMYNPYVYMYVYIYIHIYTRIDMCNWGDSHHMLATIDEMRPPHPSASGKVLDCICQGVFQGFRLRDHPCSEKCGSDGLSVEPISWGKHSDQPHQV